MANCQNNMTCFGQRTGYPQRPSCRRGMPEPRRDDMRNTPRQNSRETSPIRKESCHSTPSQRQTCDCHNKKEDLLYGLPLAMAYVPWQHWRNIYDVSKGFHRGTIFEELDKPFHGRGGCNR